jgi:hypothetical protein
VPNQYITNKHRFSAADAAGLRVFPVKPSGKVPAVQSWKTYVDRNPTPEELSRWDAGNCNVGVVTGKPSGVVVLDVDSAEAQAVVDELNLPPTPIVRTARGRHYYFQHPAVSVRNSVGIAGHHLDFRGDGGYVVGAGSIHETGAKYHWEIAPDELPFAKLPDQVLSLLSQAKSRGRGTSAVFGAPATEGRFKRILDVASAEALATVAESTESRRNNTLFAAATRLAEVVAGADADWSTYSVPLGEAALNIGLEAAEIGHTLASAWKTGSSDPTPWMVTAREWLFLSKPNVFRHLSSGQYVSIDSFNNTFASQRVEKGTFANYLLSGKFVESVFDIDYVPGEPGRRIERDGLVWLNSYRPSDIVAVAGDPSPFVEFLAYLVPEPAEREHLLRMIAWTVRNPGAKLHHALMLRSKAQGIGKSMLVEIWSLLLGKNNVRKTTTEEMKGQYQGFIKETLLVVLEELNFGFGPSDYNRIKDLITGTEASVNEKFLPVRTWPNVASFVILTNIKVPIVIEGLDRRIFYIDSDVQKREPEYYREFAKWWNGNLGVIRSYLESVDLSEFSPHAAPPMTEAKQALIADGRSDLVKDLMIAIKDRVGPLGRDVVTFAQIENALGSAMRGKSQTNLRNALSDIGAQSLGQHRVPGIKLPGGQMPSERVSLWVIRNIDYWASAGPAARGDEYRRHEGLLAPWDGLRIGIKHINDWPADVPQ